MPSTAPTSPKTMSFQPDHHHNNNNNPSSFVPSPPLKNWLNNHMVLAMQLHSLSDPKSKTLIPNFTTTDDDGDDGEDPTLRFSDEILLRIFSKLPDSQRNSNSLVCKRWLNLQGRLVRSLRVFDWNFVLSGRLIHRFPNLTHVDLVHASFVSPRNGGVWLSHRVASMHVDSDWCFGSEKEEKNLLPAEEVDRGLKELARGCPSLRKLEVTGASEEGLVSVGKECCTLQELELQKCNDDVLRGVGACGNLQVVKLIGSVLGFYESVVSDIGLTILAQGCKRLVKLELQGCEGSFDGVKAIGKCCVMLEELTVVDHRMDEGWLAGLSFCENLKTLRFVSCKVIDSNPGLVEHLGLCPALERLQFQKCLLRDKDAVGAVFSVCRAAKEIVLQDCWGLDDGVFSLAAICR